MIPGDHRCSGWTAGERDKLRAGTAFLPPPFQVTGLDFGSSTPSRVWCAYRARFHSLETTLAIVKQSTDYGSFFDFRSETTGAGGACTTLAEGIEEAALAFRLSSFGPNAGAGDKSSINNR